jgi:hypothetical protein
MAVQQSYYADFSATGSMANPAKVATFSKLSEEWWGRTKCDAAARDLGRNQYPLPVRLSVLSCSLVTGWWRKCRSNPSLNSFPLLKELAS